MTDALASILEFGTQVKTARSADVVEKPAEEDDEEFWLFCEEDDSLPTTICSNGGSSIRSSLEVGLSNTTSSLLWAGTTSTVIVPTEYNPSSSSSWIGGSPPIQRGGLSLSLLGSLTKPMNSSMLTELTVASTVLSGWMDNDDNEEKETAVPQEVISHYSSLYEETTLMPHDDEELENLPSFSYDDDALFQALSLPVLPPLLLSKSQILQKTQRWGEQVNDHHVRRLKDETKALKIQMSTLREDLTLSKQSAVEFEQENALLQRQIDQLEAQLCNSAQTLKDSERFQSQRSAEWKHESDRLHMELGNVKRQLEALTFAYNESRGTHTMDLDLCGDQVWALSEHVRKQRAVIARLSDENKELLLKASMATTTRSPETTLITSSSLFPNEITDLQTRLNAASAKVSHLEASLDKQVCETNNVQKEKAILLSDQAKKSNDTISFAGSQAIRNDSIFANRNYRPSKSVQRILCKSVSFGGVLGGSSP
jgi:hypothetical protein